MGDTEVKQQVRQFYDQVGWQMAGGGVYQNARYEDLRPVSGEYIHRCHMRVKRHLKQNGRLLLDAGSGPVQYPEYQTYSQGYQHRVCLDISMVALVEARKRLGEHGLYVVADVSKLPFKNDVFDGIVSLHTLHHLPADDQQPAYEGIYRVLSPGSTAVVVNGWTHSALMRLAQPLVSVLEHVGIWIARRRGKPTPEKTGGGKRSADQPTGTYVQKLDAAWLSRLLNGKMQFRILVWRSVSVRFLRAVIYGPLGGRRMLKLLFWLEERFPAFFGKYGQYPLIVIRK